MAYIDTEGCFRQVEPTANLHGTLMECQQHASMLLLQRQPWGHLDSLSSVHACLTRRPERIRPIAERFGLDAEAVLDNVYCARAHTYENQFGEGRLGSGMRVALRCLTMPANACLNAAVHFASLL